MNSCRDIVDLIMDYLDDDLDPEAKEDFDLHIKDCSDCTAFLNTYKKSTAIFRKVSCEDIPKELVLKIKKMVRKKGRS